MKTYTGLTLIELIVSTAILGGLLAIGFIMISNNQSIFKAKDIERKQDLQEIKNALDTYYSDNNCYPQTIPFGSEWKVGETVYMTEVPEDTSCANDSTRCYIYKHSGQSCPQWFALFTYFEVSGENVSDNTLNSELTSCSLSQLSSCVPSDFTTSWGCISSGNVDCSSLSSSRLNEGSTPAGCDDSERIYKCSGTPTKCNVVNDGTGVYCSFACGGAC